MRTCSTLAVLNLIRRILLCYKSVKQQRPLRISHNRLYIKLDKRRESYEYSSVSKLTLHVKSLFLPIIIVTYHSRYVLQCIFGKLVTQISYSSLAMNMAPYFSFFSSFFFSVKSSAGDNTFTSLVSS